MRLSDIFIVMESILYAFLLSRIHDIGNVNIQPRTNMFMSSLRLLPSECS